MKTMTIVMSCLLCFSSIAHGMDKKKSHSKRDKKSHKKGNIPDLDLTVKSSPKDKKPVGMSGSSGTPKKQVVIASTETPKATGTPKAGTPKTPAKSLEDLKRHVIETKAQTARKDDPSTT